MRGAQPPFSSLPFSALVLETRVQLRWTHVRVKPRSRLTPLNYFVFLLEKIGIF